MLIKHSLNTGLKCFFAIARFLIVGHEKLFEALVSIVSIVILLLCRRLLFHNFDFKEEE